jgi:uncharacterized membrane protein YkvA (DUF1232 family)
MQRNGPEQEIIPPSAASGDGARKQKAVRDNFWTSIRRLAASNPFTGDLLAAWYCAMDPQSPARVRVTLIGALAYFILPADAIPDILALVGFTDDMAVLAAAIAAVGANVTPAHRQAAKTTLARWADDSGKEMDAA